MTHVSLPALECHTVQSGCACIRPSASGQGSGYSDGLGVAVVLAREPARRRG